MRLQARALRHHSWKWALVGQLPTLQLQKCESGRLAHPPPLLHLSSLEPLQCSIYSLVSTVTKSPGHHPLLSRPQSPTPFQLEDFLIAHCFYPGLLKGKLDQAARCLQVGTINILDGPKAMA